MQWFMRPLITVLVFPKCLWLPKFIKTREQFAGQDYRSKRELLRALDARVADSLTTSPASVRQWVERRFYPAFIRSMHLMRKTRPEINDVLKELHERGIRLAVYSDYARTQERLKALGIETAVFDAMESAEEAGALKPHPRPLQELAVRLNCPPEQIVMVGDRDDTDGMASRAAGMQFVQVGKRENSASHLSWTELKAFFRSLPEDEPAFPAGQ